MEDRNMKKIIFVLIVFSLTIFNYAGNKEGKISGVVIDKKTGEALTGVNILVLDMENVGTSTGIDGGYEINNLSAGDYKLRFSLVGYESVFVDFSLLPGADKIINVELAEKAINVDEVVVTGEKNQLDDIRTGLINIKPEAVKKLPGAGEDVLRSLKSLPGVTSVSDMSAQFAVRGSGPEENLVLIDGFEVINPYRLYGFTSMFNPETVSEINLQKGGFTAEYGDRLSSVLKVRSRNGNPGKALGGQINMSLTNMNLIFEGALPVFENSSYLISARRTYYDMIVGPMLKASNVFDGNVALPNFRDIQGKFNLPVNNSHLIQINLLSSNDGMNLLSSAEREQVDSINAKDDSRNDLIGVTYNFIPSENLMIETQLSYYKNGGTGTMNMRMADPTQYSESPDRNGSEGISLMSWDQNYDYDYTKKSISQKLLWQTGLHSIEFGYGADALRTDITNHLKLDENYKEYLTSQGKIFPTDVTESQSYNKFNLFLSDAVTIDGLTVKAGLRMDAYPVLKEKIFVSPRINLSYMIDETSAIRAAFGKYYQSPGMEKQDIWNNLNFGKENLKNLVPESADHYIFGYQKMLNEKWELKTEGYYKKLSNIIVPMKVNVSGLAAEQISGSPRNSESWNIVESNYDSLTNIPVNSASGNSYGLEIMLEKINTGRDDKFSGWISYALSFAERENGGIISPFRYDQRHALNIAGNYRFAESWELGVNFTLRSGKPYSLAAGIQPRIKSITEDGKTYYSVQTNENGEVILDVNNDNDNYNGRLNLYHTLNLRITKYTVWFGLNWSFYLDVQNIYNRKNEEQVNYYIDANGSLKEKFNYGLPVFPSLGLSVSF